MDVKFLLDPLQSLEPNFTLGVYSSSTLITCYLSETDSYTTPSAPQPTKAQTYYPGLALHIFYICLSLVKMNM